jgi:hypothetical protein
MKGRRWGSIFEETQLYEMYVCSCLPCQRSWTMQKSDVNRNSEVVQFVTDLIALERCRPLQAKQLQ